MSNKTPYEIRLDLVREAREILQARAKNPEDMPTTEKYYRKQKDSTSLLASVLGKTITIDNF